MNFEKFVRKPFLQNTTGRLLLIIVVIIVKGELANETVNYDTKVKKDSPDERIGFRSSRSHRKHLC